MTSEAFDVIAGESGFKRIWKTSEHLQQESKTTRQMYLRFPVDD